MVASPITFVTVLVRHKDKFYKHDAAIHHYGDSTALRKEIEYWAAIGGKKAGRDVVWDDEPSRPTNPFAWSPGPTRCQFYK